MNNQQQKKSKLHVGLDVIGGYVNSPKSQASGRHRINPVLIDPNLGTRMQVKVSENLKIIASDKFAEKPQSTWQKFTRKLAAFAQKVLRHFN